ncbi:hypothetical protein ArsFIN_18160 [Arsenophonus nasoniae]|uniref:Uncharacterized protein n=1 Tax=Arsenophonus nasoniae TaxID=638 RepID=A0A4P7KT19_9GAMM|nr:hypothetical protein ArsFIN_18160 [Arsenophonus nasoniae]
MELCLKYPQISYKIHQDEMLLLKNKNSVGKTYNVGMSLPDSYHSNSE